eukprot:TRINITY_DN12454_c0_g1_i1.p1 TRINITY_DN12454_c0_g1~~TRINITY_DN12454_c0_g1_i1.p1  ORF type:complete len:219 (-),score=17.78 TRINITY_DN12454_c0_g1_i1:61-717(-)
MISSTKASVTMSMVLLSFIVGVFLPPSTLTFVNEGLMKNPDKPYWMPVPIDEIPASNLKVSSSATQLTIFLITDKGIINETLNDGVAVKRESNGNVRFSFSVPSGSRFANYLGAGLELILQEGQGKVHQTGNTVEVVFYEENLKKTNYASFWILLTDNRDFSFRVRIDRMHRIIFKVQQASHDLRAAFNQVLVNVSLPLIFKSTHTQMLVVRLSLIHI